jgi:hypothetical protein
MKSQESHAREGAKIESPVREHETVHDEEYVSNADVEVWATRVRAQRRAWLEGPSEEEKRAWAERERRRRTRGLERDDYDDDEYEGRRIAERWRRDLELVLTGLAGRIVEPPYALIGNLAREGRRYEDEFHHARRRRRRVLADEDI